jgi:hypothetical protein
VGGACRWERRNFLNGKQKRRKPLGGHRYRWEDDVTDEIISFRNNTLVS